MTRSPKCLVTKALLFCYFAVFSNAYGRPALERLKPREAWNKKNAPERFWIDQAFDFEKIPKKGRLKDMPWSGPPWPTYQGGISHRWQSLKNGLHYTDFIYKIPKNSTKLSAKRIRRLSPAEKYDLWLDRMALPLTHATRKEILNAVNPAGDVPYWYGICKGWAAASFQIPIKKYAITVQNKIGQNIRFYRDDIRALISQTYARSLKKSRFIGDRCYDHTVQILNGRIVNRACRDVNPATFHIVANVFINQRQQAFIADIESDHTVWNHPIVGYRFSHRRIRPWNRKKDPLAAFRAANTAYLVSVKMTYTFVDNVAPSRRRQKNIYTKRKLTYTLELDAQKRIVGGEWHRNVNAPDFLWVPTQAPNDTSLLAFTKIMELVEMANQP